MGGLRLITAFAVLHCDKVSWLGHIEAPTVRFVVKGLIVSGDNGLSKARRIPKKSDMILCRCKARTSEAGDFPDGCRRIGQSGH
jgi:hypothetical protein